MFELFGSVFSKFGETWFGSQIDTLVDKLNRNVTVAILIGMTIMTLDPLNSSSSDNFDEKIVNNCISNLYIPAKLVTSILQWFQTKFISSLVQENIFGVLTSLGVKWLKNDIKKVSAKQYVGEPIQCLGNKNHDGDFVKFINNLCWVTNNYIVPNDVVIQQGGLVDSEFEQINYYQWVPLILLVQALFFYIPHLVWKALLTKSGLDLMSIVSTGAQVAVADNREERDKKIKYMASQVDIYLTHYQDMSDNWIDRKCSKFGLQSNCICGKRGGSFIVFLYMLHKVLYMLNIILQILILNVMFTKDLHSTAWGAIYNLFRTNAWPESDIFPRQTLCQFETREFGSVVHKQIVRCALSINFFHEKVFIFIWLWIIMLAVFTGISILVWALHFIFQVDRVRFVKRYLKIMNRATTKHERSQAHEFIQKYLRQDGVFVLRLVNLNVSGMVTGQLVARLWDDYRGPIKSTLKSSAPHLDDVDNGTMYKPLKEAMV